MAKELVRELLRPNIYPEPTNNVELVQTHISFIFICDDYVYKVKKPVNFGFLDFTTLEKREHYCNQEIKLNKRLSPDTYLKVVGITDEGETLAIDGKGPVVEYAVKMSRIPLEKLMLTLLENGKLTEEMVGAVAKKLADFHEGADNSSEIDRFGTIEINRQNTDENFEQTEKYIGTSISREQFSEIKRYTDSFYEKNRGLFEKRIDDKMIRDCHGDLHMEHICLTDPIIIFDCIEFNERFRYSDVIADVAFLAMDLDYQGQDELSHVLIEEYVNHSGDSEAHRLLDFYKTYRAYVRGKVISFRLDDPDISHEDKEEALRTARRYFELADRYAKRDKQTHDED
jgi:aminoglycoside phosphotransferase family enzyme